MTHNKSGRELPTPDRRRTEPATTQPIYGNDTCRGVCRHPHTHNGAFTICLTAPFTPQAASSVQFPLCGALHVVSDGEGVSPEAVERLAWRIGHRDITVDLPSDLVDAWVRGVVDLILAGCFFGVAA